MYAQSVKKWVLNEHLKLFGAIPQYSSRMKSCCICSTLSREGVPYLGHREIFLVKNVFFPNPSICPRFLILSVYSCKNK